MADVPEDYDSGPDESLKLRPKRTKSLRSRKSLNVESDTVAKVRPELSLEIDQEPVELKTKEDDFEEEEAGSAENIPIQPTRTPEEEIPKETMLDLPSQTELETSQMLELQTSLEVDEKQELDVIIEPPTETDTQLPKETKVPEATSSETVLELPEKTEQKVSEQSIREEDEEIDPEQNTPGFPSEKAGKSVEEEYPPPSKMTKLEITEKTHEESAEGKGTEPSEVTKPEFPDQELQESTEEAELKPPEEIQIKTTEQVTTEEPAQIKPEFPDEITQPTEEKVPEPLEKLNLQLLETESRKQVNEASRELLEKSSEVSMDMQNKSFEENIPETQGETTLGLLKEVKSDIQGETKKKSVEKISEPLEDREPTDQKEMLRKTTGKSKSKETLAESTKEKGLLLQEQTEQEFSKKELIKSTEEIGQEPPQMTQTGVQKTPQPEPAKEKALELSDEPKPRGRDTVFPKEDRPEPGKLKYPVGKDKLVYSDHPKKLSEDSDMATHEYVLGTPKESTESVTTVYDFYDPLKGLQAELSELYLMHPASESRMDLRDSVTEKKDVVLLKKSERQDKEFEINRSASPQFEHLKWSTEKVAEWIGELGFPQYKECFLENFINGPKLIYVNCSNLPQMGITDFEDMKEISRHTRNLLGIEDPSFSRSIRLPYRDNIGLFLEQKGHSGVKSDALNFSEFVEASGLLEYSRGTKVTDKNKAPLPEKSQEAIEASTQDVSLNQSKTLLGKEQSSEPFHLA